MKADKNTLEKVRKGYCPLPLPSARGYIKRPSLLIVSADASTRLLLRLELFVDFASVVSCLFTAQEVHENVSGIQEKRVWHRNMTLTLWAYTRPKGSTQVVFFPLSHSFQGGIKGKEGSRSCYIFSLTSSRARQKKETHSYTPRSTYILSSLSKVSASGNLGSSAILSKISCNLSMQSSKLAICVRFRSDVKTYSPFLLTLLDS